MLKLSSFHYVAIDLHGKKRKGTVEALHLAEAKEKLRAQGAIALNISALKKRESTKKISKDDIIAFTEQLAELNGASVPLYETLLSLEEGWRKESLHPVIVTLMEELKEGQKLSSSMKRFPDLFSPLYLSMIAAGEKVGALDKALYNLSRLLKKQHLMRKKVISALLYPALLFSFSMVVVLALFLFVIPSLEMLFEGRNVNTLTSTLIATSRFVTTKWPFYLPILTIAGLSLIFVPKKKERLFELATRIPLLKRVIVESSISRFTSTLATLLEGGLNLTDAITTAKGVISVPALEKEIAHAQTKLIEGSRLSIELRKSELLPTLVARMVAIGEEGGNMAVMLYKISDFYEEEVDKLTNRFLTLLGPLILLFMGVIVGIIMMAILLPLTDINAFIEG